MMLRRYHDRRNEQQVEEPVVTSNVEDYEESLNKLELDELKALTEELELEIDSEDKADYISALLELENLEQVLSEIASNEVNFEEMTVEELTAYAEEHGIDIGKATSQNGIISKIVKAEEPVVTSNVED